jgi:uncharacterized phage protein (TIGR01671 family)
MREIKFRAKRKDSGDWAYGYYVKTPITAEFTAEGQYFDSGYGRHCIVQNGVAHEIDIESLGQYTGLRNKNGKEIYEGDIVVIDEQLTKEAEIKRNVAVITFEDGGYHPQPRGEDFEVAGNIYENPELLTV